MKPDNPSCWISPAEAAPILGVSVYTTIRWCKRGKLFHRLTPFGYFLIRREDAKALARSMESVRRVRKRPDAAQIAARDEAALREIEAMG